MKQYLLPKTERLYKANMHTHTTCSDGDMTPEEIKDLYKSHGYQIIAYSDHDFCFPQSALNDEDFLALTSYEVAINEQNPRSPYHKCYHLNLFARDPENTKIVCHDPVYGRRKMQAEPELAEKLDIWSAEERVYSVEYINHLIEEAQKAGFFVSYNHPTWSQQDYTDYIGLKGVWGVEVYNSDCAASGYVEDDVRVYEDMLRAGIPVFPLATDDVHKLAGALGGWLMVAAKSLAYGDVISALENGDFYASNGAEIHSLTLEDGKLKITCAPASYISIATECRCAFRVNAPEDSLLTEAEFDLRKWFDLCEEDKKENAYFRVTVIGPDGKRAWSRPYYRKEIAGQF